MARLLNIDLTSKKVWWEDIEALRRGYIGGVGINARLAYDLIPRGADSFGAENVLIFGVGPFVGTNIPTACRTEVTAKSPLTNLLGTSSSGLYWGAQMRYAGFDHIAIFGRSPSPVYLLIRDGEVQIKDASHLWRKSTWGTLEALRQREGEGVQVASVGEGGEKMVRFASIQNNLHHAWGRTGLGGVMGSKMLKAVVVCGEHPLEVFDLQETLRMAQEATRRITKDDSFGYTRRYGTMVAADPYNKLGALPGYNFTQGSIEGWEDTRGRRAFGQRYKEKDLACFACPIACTHWSRVKEGEHLGYQFHGLEITYDMEFGAKLGIKSIPEIVLCVDLCSQYGVDVVSTAGVISFLIECYQNGLVGKEEIGGEVGWGDVRGIRRLIKMIAHREGIGDLLAEGVRRASAKIRGSEGYALHIKGGEIPVRDPRAKWDVWSLGYLTNVRGGDHLRARSPAEYLPGGIRNHLEEELGVSEEFIEGMDIPSGLKEEIFGQPPHKVDIPKMAKYAEELITLINAAGVCIRPPVLRTFGPELFSQGLRATLGLELSPEEVLRAGERIWNLQHLFNLREGEKIEGWTFPDRFYQQDTGRGVLDQEKVKETLMKYFITRGWDPETGFPNAEKLEELGLLQEGGQLRDAAL
ncbi:MAG: aldehyde ferredoxin oxidoreductase family protein [Deltaproteobacteria bacterium]|nr:aldehyde ferredoxin oxidoreductase family protein [Deltaproteobacteria bacterium]